MAAARRGGQQSRLEIRGCVPLWEVSRCAVAQKRVHDDERVAEDEPVHPLVLVLVGA